jgi:ribosomal protein S18 acetylase RimI-like enzyme
MIMMQQGSNEDFKISIEQAKASDVPAIASIFTESFNESVRHHCGGLLPKPQAMQDVFTLVYEAEPQAAFVARTALGQVVGYCFAPTQLSHLWVRALRGGYLVKWAWRWLTGKYGFGLHPLRIIVMNKVAFFCSAATPRKKANARILSIAIAPKTRGQGVGGQLFRSAMDYFREKKTSRVRLEVRPENDAAIRLYEKWNFVRDGYTADSQGQWLIMVKEMEKYDV